MSVHLLQLGRVGGVEVLDSGRRGNGLQRGLVQPNPRLPIEADLLSTSANADGVDLDPQLSRAGCYCRGSWPVLLSPSDNSTTTAGGCSPCGFADRCVSSSSARFKPSPIAVPAPADKRSERVGPQTRPETAAPPRMRGR